jgi:hypothetical protein
MSGRSAASTSMMITATPPLVPADHSLDVARGATGEGESSNGMTSDLLARGGGSPNAPAFLVRELQNRERFHRLLTAQAWPPGPHDGAGRPNFAHAPVFHLCVAD